MARFEPALKPKLIYVFAIDDEQHRDCLKVGETTLEDDQGLGLPPPNSPLLNQAAHARIKQYTQTCGISYRLLHTEMTVHIKASTVRAFSDHDVHRVLQRSRIQRKDFGGAREWYLCDLATVRRAIEAVKQGHESLHSHLVAPRPPDIRLRPEQREAVERTKTHFRRGSRMLWNAKMRFGKTLTALQLVKELGYARVLIITHRPVVDSGWFEDFGKIFHDHPHHHYGSAKRGESLASLQALAAKGDSYIYFASMQDLRGSADVGGRFDKNNEIFSTTWHLVIIDEAHEGTQTELGQAVLAQLAAGKTKVLQLSGTPFNLLGHHRADEVYTWDYIMEQRAKIDWEINHLGTTNPYAALPAISIYTYDLGRLLSDYSEEERSFNFREFFRTHPGDLFAHDHDIDRFLDLLCQQDDHSLYPYSCEAFRAIFRHTLWIVPGVAAARALSRKLDAHPIFSAFHVVNVAGEGDQEEEGRDALQKVNRAIGSDPDQTYTITLSCGRLTAGVSIAPWTGVFLMAGSHSTSAASYMQTIFRVQTPYTHGGRIKTHCYAFDFAPDRTLRMLTETARSARGSGRQRESDRAILGDFLNFCPVIAIEGSQMKPYDVDAMLAQLKRAQIERVVQGGFEDGALYNDLLLQLTAADLQAFDHLKATIGTTRAMPLPGDIEVNRQGLTSEQHQELAQLARRRRSTLSLEEQERLSALRAIGNQRRNAIAILRGISIRMPLMLYGAEINDEEQELTIDNFANLVDDASWAEFMPSGVTKEVFGRFRRYYDRDVFREAGRRIRALARAADRCTIEERISRITALFATFRNPDKETVLTPWRVVNMHLAEALGGYCFMDEAYEHPLETPRYVPREGVTSRVFHPESTILDINSKSGLYPLYAAYSIYRARLAKAGQTHGQVPRPLAMQLWDATLSENILVLCKTPMARSITLRTLAGFRRITVRAHCYPNLIPHIARSLDQVVGTLQSSKRFWNTKRPEPMKIDAIIGNPPYQVATDNSRANPVYHLFMDLAFRLAPQVCLITPARFLFRAGFTPSAWNEKILNDEHFRVVWYRASSLDVFPHVDIMGGVAVVYRNQAVRCGKIGVFKAYAELESICRRVASAPDAGRLSDIIHAESSYRFNIDNPVADGLVKGRLGNDRKVISNVFDKLPDIFTREQREGAVGFYGRSRGQRCVRFVDRALIEPHPNLDCYKVLVPKSNGSGAIGEVRPTPLIGEPLIGEPQIGATQTFLTVGAFSTRQEAEACLKYVKSQFARTMLGVLKATQDNPKDVWRLVPLQDFTPASDIDWSGTVAQIDQQLYRKYSLEEAEVRFIETMVRPME